MWRMQQFHQNIVVTIYPGEMSIVSPEVNLYRRLEKAEWDPLHAQASEKILLKD